MKLIDTSSWIEFLRGHKTEPAFRVKQLLREDRASWCDLIAAELWNGVRPVEKKALDDLEKLVTPFALSGDVWQVARKLALRCRESGLTVPTADIIIAACATHYELEMEYCDAHFNKILPVAAKLN